MGASSISGTTGTHYGFIADALLPRIAPAHLNAMLMNDLFSFIMFVIKLQIVIAPIQNVKGGTRATPNNKTGMNPIMTFDQDLLRKVSNVFVYPMRLEENGVLMVMVGHVTDELSRSLLSEFAHG